MHWTRLLLLAVVFSPAAPCFQGAKVGIVDADQVIQKTVKGKEFLAEMEAFSKAKEDELKALQDQIQTAKNDLETKVAALSDEKVRELKETLAKLQNDLSRKAEDSQRELQTKMNKGLDIFRRNLTPLIREVALEKGLDLVLNMGPQSQVVYVHDRINITDDVVKKYDETVQ